MLPSLLAREVQNGLKHFLTTGFEPSDRLFAGVMRRFTEDESRWMKGPYLQVGLPFRVGTQGKGFFSGFETEHPGFVHQEEAWERLASDRMAQGTLVATGTGSGKTECFLYPVLDHCARSIKAGVGGIKALVIYPMNALASDQARRFAEVVAATPQFKGLRVGLFVGGKSGVEGRGQPTMTRDSVITDRKVLRQDPPDVLLTNYKMLDYLLIRPRDRRLWSRNKVDTLRYVVVDELHTFDGAQGTDLALLLRRLRSRLKIPEGHLIHTGTSATLGGNTDTGPLREYARQIFGMEFPEDAVVKESRLTELEFLGDSTIEHVLYPRPDFAAVLDPEPYATQEDAIAAWFTLFFPDQPPPASVRDAVWREDLGRLLKKHLLFVNFLKLMRGQITELAELQQQMRGPLPESARAHIGAVLDALLALVAWARAPHQRPLVTLRVQLWMRELRRMVATVDHDPGKIELRSDKDVKPETGKLHLPLVQCPDCHTTGWLSRMPNGTSKVSTALDEIYNCWFASQPEILRLYALDGLTRPLCEGVAQRLCPNCGNLQVGRAHCSACGHEQMVDVYRTTAVRNSTNPSGVVNTWYDKSCPACGTGRDPMLLGARSATLGAVTIEQTWASPYNDDKKLIAFSDSVQDAAHRAGFFTARTYQNTVRTGLSKVIDEVAKPRCSWPVFLERAAAVWGEEGSPLFMEEERFVAEFIGPNMTWQRDWAESLLKEDRLPYRSKLPDRVRKRFAWQAFAEFTYLSRRGRNLEAIGKAVLVPKLEAIESASDAAWPLLQERLGLRSVTRLRVLHWLWGFVCRLRLQGAVAHPEMGTYMRDGNVWVFSQKGGRKEWLPGIGPRAAQPKFLSLTGQKGMEHLVLARGKSFYQTWAEATLGADELLLEGAGAGFYRDLYNIGIKALEEWKVLLRVAGEEGDVIGLNPEELILETEVTRLSSEQGKRGLTVPRAAAEVLLGMPCLQAPQEVYTSRNDEPTWLARHFSRSELRRVFSAEHTGLLERDQREALERRFKVKTPQPWYENLLSATPTLEMGVDIGDLSSVMLCSVPPNQASYLQRIGRAGRRDGNAFTSTMADGASPHDLYFFEDTREMLNGEVVPPGIFLKAPEVLRRQLFAFCLDDWVGSGIAETSLPDKTKEALDARDSHATDKFPYLFTDYVNLHEDRLLKSFQGLLGEDLDDRVALRLEGFMKGTDHDDGLRMRLSKLLDELSKERKSYKDRAKSIGGRVKELEKRPKDEAVTDEIDQLKREQQKLLSLSTEISGKELLNTLTDAGLIPNYAFPEAGVELKSLLWRKRSNDDPADAGAYISLPAESYERPAHSALAEFAPENTFYANQRRVEVDQINMQLSAMEDWRLCPSCQYMSNLAIHADSDGVCPRCSDPMWSNVSQKRQLIRFKQAIANSNDTEVRIDDSAEDREPKFYVRELMTDFEAKDIKEAYRLKSPEIPFGFEFIERVVFRDVNFGEMAKLGGEAYAVAGKSRARPGFKLCKHCGQVQRKPRTKRERGLEQLHAFDCEKRDSADAGNLAECLYLYREFTSEALRILMPYTRSGVEESSVASFMAAVQLGLKQRFGGKVDHLRMITQEVQGRDGGANRHYLLLYDSVPGGTGYLHELLASEAKTLVEALRLALDRVVNCSCAADPEKDGCYRCLYQYRQGRAMADVSRRRAQEILQQLVGSLDQLEKVTSVADIYVNPNFDSELESKFVESLRRIGGKGGLPFVKLVQDIVKGKAGFLMEVAGQRYWVEPQAALGPSEGVAVMCQPDFVFWPAKSRSRRRPVAVFCDGWTYHQAITREDAAKRNGLVASGQFWVWAVTWEDVQSALAEAATTSLAESIPAMAPVPLPPALAGMFDGQLWTHNAVAGLIRWLGMPALDDSDGYAFRLARHAGATALKTIVPPGHADYEAAQARLAKFWNGLDAVPCPKPDKAMSCGNLNETALMLRYWFPLELAKADAILPQSRGFVVLDETQLQSESDRHQAWRRWLWLFNVFQTLPGVFLATRPGLEAGDHHAIQLSTGSKPAAGGGAAAHDGGWSVVMDQAMDSLTAGLTILRDHGIPVPDEIGYELEEGNTVVAEAELAWVKRRLVLLMPHHEESMAAWQSRGWTTVNGEGDWAQHLLDIFNQTTASGGQSPEVQV
jgi:DEAD/DEAH box helicase domain-containing protein